MPAKRSRPFLTAEFTAGARVYAPDIATTLILFFGACLLAGRAWRFPFDDEVYTLTLLERISARDLLTVYPAANDVHPPLSYLLFDALQHLGLSEASMRLCSLAMTAVALVLWQLIALTFIARRGTASPAIRLIAVLLFALAPLAVSQGDALRWYPLFAMLIAVFATLTLSGNGAARLGAAVVLGLAASTNLLAATVALAFALYRYGLQRRFEPTFDAAFWSLALLFGSLGAYTAGSLLFSRYGEVAIQLGHGVVVAVLTDGLGFFGGRPWASAKPGLSFPPPLFSLGQPSRPSIASGRVSRRICCC